MSQTDPTPIDPHQEISGATPEEKNKQSSQPIWQATPDEVWKAFGNLFEKITPWLFEFGSWIFGGLIAFTLLVMAPLITIGPVDPAIMVATTAFALALPLNVTGLFLLKLLQDLKKVGFEEGLAQAFQEAGFTVGEQVATPTSLEAMRQRRTRVVLSSSLGILVLSALLTLTGMTATLWHLAWWIGVVFLAMVMLCLVIVNVAFVTSQPPDSPEEKERKRRYREEMTRQAKEQYQKNKVMRKP
jgi:ABC-type multidrug transport system fused ATPase/permease subunit